MTTHTVPRKVKEREKIAGTLHGVSPELQKRRVPLGRVPRPAAGASGTGSFPNMLYHGGPILANPQIWIVYLGDWTSTANQNRATRLTQFVTDFLNSSYMNVLSQYGVGTSGTVGGSVFIANTNNTLTDNDIQTIVQNAINSTDPNTHVPEPVAGSSLAYILYLDDATGVTDAQGGNVLCEASNDNAFGYHTSFTTTAGNPCYVAIVPGLSDTCLTNSCPDDSTCSLHKAQTQEQRQTQVTSHELAEMITDPAVAASNFGWDDTVTNNEIGDICNGNPGSITVGSNTWNVQQIYSRWDDIQSNGGTMCVASAPNPLPSLLPLLYFDVDKSTFGKDETQDAIATAGGTFPNAFWLTLQGYSINQLAGKTPVISGSFLAISGIAVALNASGPIFENPSDQFTPQRIVFPYDITFTNAALASFPSSGTAQEALDASIAMPGFTPTAETVFELVAGADPYFTNVNPAENNVFWLSQDLRVFTATPALNNTPVGGAGAPVFGADSVSAAFQYIQDLLAYLNANYGNTAGSDPFASIFPDQSGALTGDSSVTPSTVSGGNTYSNYNFAVARVRLRGTSGTSGEADNVRVFFRLFTTQSNDTDYQPGSTYSSNLDAAGLPGSPLLGSGNQTIPFFATGNYSTNTDYNTGGVNMRNVVIPSGNDSVWAYFGCFINLYDPANIINGQAVQTYLNGTHHCIVAQIAYDGAPIVNANGVTMSPENSDKLAQRNLQVTLSDNPGGPSTHRIPQTFDLRPSAPAPAGVTGLPAYPDELVVDWGKTPAGSTATIYWPDVDAAKVVSMASQLYTTRLISAVDANTIQCKVLGGLTYIPIPPNAHRALAGLFTVDLPPSVRTGQEFDIVVRRMSTRRLRDFRTNGNGAAAARQALPQWRYVVGTFQIRIPVSSANAMLPSEENTLAILKYRFEQMPATSRWYPVMQRYIDYIGARVAGLGGDPNAIPPSPQGFTGTPVTPKTEHVDHTGKVEGLMYDRFGDFEGFIFMDEDGRELRFYTREGDLEDLIEDAWKDRILLTVSSHHHEKHRPDRITLRRYTRG